MNKLLNFIFSKKDEGIYRKRTILGIKIITKPVELRLKRIEEKINFIYLTSNSNIDNMLMKLKVYEIYSKHKNKSYLE